MKSQKPAITAERLREVLDYNPETGVFTWKVVTSNRVKKGAVAGTPNKPFGYTQVMIDGRIYRSARLAWLWAYGSWPADDVDHINGVRNDDRLSNLRAVSRAVNQQNLRNARGMSRSGLLGVHRMSAARRGSKLWVARIKVDGKPIHLGYFEDKFEAHEVYLAAKRRLHEGCTI